MKRDGVAASRLRRLRGLWRATASAESMDRLNDIPLRPANARPRPAPPMVMAPDESRFQRHSAHLRTRIIDSTEASSGVDVVVAELELHDEATPGIDSAIDSESTESESTEPVEGANEPN